MVVVAIPQPVTDGTPYSRQTMAAWLVHPPISVTAALIFVNIGAHDGVVDGQTRTSPGCRSTISFSRLRTRAGPSATPADEAKPFTTHLNALDTDMYLRVAPELYLKRLVIGGYERVFEIARNFRNEGMDQTHQPEFTMIEFYEAYRDYRYLMDFTERLFAEVARKVLGTTVISYQGHELDLGKPGFEGVDPAATGRPACHPAMLLKLCIYTYLNRIQSSRRLEREAQRNPVGIGKR